MKASKLNIQSDQQLPVLHKEHIKFKQINYILELEIKVKKYNILINIKQLTINKRYINILEICLSLVIWLAKEEGVKVCYC